MFLFVKMGTSVIFIVLCYVICFANYAFDNEVYTTIQTVPL